MNGWRCLTAGVIVPMLLALDPHPRSASANSPTIGGGEDGTKFVVHGAIGQEGSATSTSSSNPVVEWKSSPYCSANPLECSPEECQGTGESHWANWVHADGTEGQGYVCVGGENAGTQQITMADVLREFRRIPLPESTITIQPPDGRTLVNFDTIYSTAAEPFNRTVRLLGQQVDLEITPAQFNWNFGDGQARTTTWPGRPWSKTQQVNQFNYILHQYATAPATVRPSVDTTWSARFRVNNGPWQPVNGTITKQGPGVPLDIVEAAPALVSEHPG